jgi:hypothetical protein
LAESDGYYHEHVEPSLITEDLRIAMKEMSKADQKEMRKELVLEKINYQECVICLEPLSQLPGDPETVTGSIFRTPCNHMFHKKCLKDWMVEKNQCPNCRAALPAYQSI